MVDRQHLSGSPKSRLNLISNEEDIVLLAQIVTSLQIPFIRNDNTNKFIPYLIGHILPCFALNGLHQESSHTRTMLLQSLT